MQEITVNGKSYFFPLGVKLSKVASDIDSIKFQCLQGKCGKCLVKVSHGNLGSVSNSEKEFLDLMGLSPSEHRLLCQCSLDEKSIVDSFKG
ncbi:MULTISPECIES: 2Fe-2S iron-sulfur cluster-binding protein [unclassified Brenneria]|uniref:2Fe-2S iron-sulfur cluster-binding protein n=1 Tax=unclassified Brenneria TaxID=2634434 RepID=UPI0018F06C7D|nr:2Fe-2S iron-sulfur cluster binding domain-containing protein [Brenneria sp. L3-3C-1]MBJ7222359.1 2Fe-2S iron-sulfur cluster binding domain-containing protein [Brenneria sp. L3-3C-1]MEE3643602.1 2Fe-2S iron-sulfur cluster binding domain-containing protein [Brenneria sp. L3_3C_1]